MKCEIYCRISDSRENLENQLTALQAEALRREYDVTAVYQEVVSGFKNVRQYQLEQALLDARAGKFSVLLIWAIDRISRRGLKDTHGIINNFYAAGVKVISLKEPFTDLPDGLDGLFISFMAWAAQFESKRKSQRVLASLEVARKKGKVLGRPKGKKDKRGVHRNKSGYCSRWERYREQKKLNKALNKGQQNIEAKVLPDNGI